MPQWNVTGADQSTGQDRRVLVEASSAESAERKVRAAGMLVSSISPADAMEVFAAVAATRPTAPHVPSDSSPQTAAGQHPNIPSYSAIVIAGVMLRVFAAIAVIGATAILAMTIYSMVKGVPVSDVDKYFPGLSRHANDVSGLITAGLLYAAGVFLYAIAYLGLAVRDIARNSFRP